MAISESRAAAVIRGRVVLVCLYLICCASRVAAQSSEHVELRSMSEVRASSRQEAGSASLFPSSLPPALSAALEQVEDYRFDFDQPAFYETVAFARDRPDAIASRDALDVVDWRDLLERPRDFRGRVIRVRGYIGSNRAWMLQSRPELGVLHQLELYAEGAPLAVTLIAPADLSDLPVGAEIEAAGVFVMMRSYYSRSNQVRPAALVVTNGPTRVAKAAPFRPEGGSALSWMLAIVVGAAAAAWLIYRSNARVPRTRLESLAARQPAHSVADEFQKWAREDGDATSAASAQTQKDASGNARDR